MSKWHNAKKDLPELLYSETYEEPDDPNYCVTHWSDEFLVIAKDERGCKHEMIAHYITYEQSGGKYWEYYDDSYGWVFFEDKGLKAIKWTADIPKRIKMDE